MLTACLEHFNIVSDSVVNISSPEYPNFYPDNLRCSWFVTSNKTNNVSVEITFHQFLTFSGSDWLTIRRGNETVLSDEIVRFNSFITPGTSIFVDEEEIWIEFRSSGIFRHVGLHLSISVTSERDGKKLI